MFNIAAFTATSILALFGCGGIALLFRQPPQSVHYAPYSIAAPLGYVSFWDAETQQMCTPTVKITRMPRGAR